MIVRTVEESTDSTCNDCPWQRAGKTEKKDPYRSSQKANYESWLSTKLIRESTPVEGCYRLREEKGGSSKRC